ncbi:Cysteine-rich RLK (receptor-like protein kinase) 8 [Gossypium australe]|uniref:Cysteine-rich RLK (Receptor-like protein kinase) 8 n=1 Tax=Gossypium australe TaxID=47621 RepID=A0A5B6WUS6_9ROSI|nr:Cysteine-rich RLK (receptor-like protein kinase) 8 [Gossypium australe]
MHSPCEEHLEAIYSILRYLRSSLEKKRNQATSVSNRRSISCYYTFVWGNLATWRRRKNAIAHNSVKEENRSMAYGICEIMWLKRY